LTYAPEKQTFPEPPSSSLEMIMSDRKVLSVPTFSDHTAYHPLQKSAVLSMDSSPYRCSEKIQSVLGRVDRAVSIFVKPESNNRFSVSSSSNDTHPG
jgi:hypothetical protein